MWADTLQVFEKQHLLQLMIWAGTSVLIGALLLLVLSVRRVQAPLLTHFAIQSTLWGIAELAWGTYAYRDVPLRDYEGAALLARELWIAVGLEAGAVLIGVTLAIGSWIYVKRLALVGAGTGIIAQASALAALDLIMVRAIQL
jgi:uncharacterized protein DUF6992